METILKENMKVRVYEEFDVYEGKILVQLKHGFIMLLDPSETLKIVPNSLVKSIDILKR